MMIAACKMYHFFTLAIVTVLLNCLFIGSSYCQTKIIYASPAGLSTGIGSSVNAAVTLSQALSVSKQYPSDTCYILLTDGFYSAIIIDSTCSRKLVNPLYIKSLNKGKAIFKPVSDLPSSKLTPIPDSIKARIISTDAQNHVQQLSLASMNLKNMTEWPNVFSLSNLTAPKLFYKGNPLPMSRYPKDSTMAMKEVLNNGTAGKMPGGSFVYRNNRCEQWLKAINDGGLFLCGAWRVPWQIDVVKTKMIDVVADTIQQVAGVGGGIGDKYSRPKGNGKEPYWAINLVEEISMPGEWCINFRTKMLYLWPPDTTGLEIAADPNLSAISATGLKNVFFEDFEIVGGAGNGITLTSASNIAMYGLTIQNCGGNAITITGGFNNLVQSCNLFNLGGTGVKISSSNFLNDQKNVTKCNHKVINNHIYNVAVDKQVYYTNVDISTAIGAYIGYNKLHHAPQIGIYFGGNSNIIEFNELYKIQYLYGGAGAIYRTGNFADRGNIVRYNYLHDCENGGGISEDNLGTGDSIYYNIVANTLLSTNNNGGYADTYANNIYFAGNQIHGSVITKDTAALYIKNYNNLFNIYNNNPIYKKTYPDVADMLDTANGKHKLFTSRMWNQWYGNVIVSNTPNTAQTFGYVTDKVMFNSNGTTNTNAASLNGDAFKKWGTVVHDNLKLSGKIYTPKSAQLIDSLKYCKVFSKTLNKQWYLNRIGLFTDQFRTTIQGDSIPGIAPILTIQHATTPIGTTDTLVVMATITNPNIANIISGIDFFVDGSTIKPAALSVKKITDDSVLYTASFVNLHTGKHGIFYTVSDSTLWRYTSATDTVDITTTLPNEIVSLQYILHNKTAILQWFTAIPELIDYFVVETGKPELNHLFAIQKANPLQKNYTTNIPNSLTEPIVLRIKAVKKDGVHLFSNSVMVHPTSRNINITCMPNPATSYLNILVSGTLTKCTIQLIDLNGKTVYTNHIGSLEYTTIPVPLGSVESGYYQLVISSNETVYKKNILINHP